MTTIELRSDIHQLVNTINDIDILRIVKEFLQKSNQTTESWDTLPNHLKKNLTAALEEAARGEFTPHEEVMQQMRTKYYK